MTGASAIDPALHERSDHAERPVLRLAHSPDPDDAFMWWPMFELDGRPPRIDTGRFRFEPVMEDIERLNEQAESATLELTALSCAHYPAVKQHYAITACGASMGDDYGPKLVAPRPISVEELLASSQAIAVPGQRTTALAALRLLSGSEALRVEVVPFDQIIDEVLAGRFAAGLVIHEGQLTFAEAGLHLVVDLGHWWRQEHELPLPLGLNAIRRDLELRHGSGTLAEITSIQRCSVAYALRHREESVRYALQFARGLDATVADQFISMYVNAWTLDFGATGRRAVREFLAALHRAGLVDDPGGIDFIE